MMFGIIKGVEIQTFDLDLFAFASFVEKLTEAIKKTTGMNDKDSRLVVAMAIKQSSVNVEMLQHVLATKKGYMYLDKDKKLRTLH